LAPSFELGYDRLLWGQNEPGQYLYGFLRPVARVTPIAVVNQGEVTLEVYPISFFRIAGGYYASYRAANETGLDCQSIQCEGLLSGPALAASLVFGFGQFVGFAEARAVRLTSSDSRSFGDEYTSLVGNGPTDTLIAYRGGLGARLSPDLVAGLLASADAMTDSKQDDQLVAGFVRYAKTGSPWKFFAGGGRLSSSTLGTGAQVFFSVAWLGMASFAPD
jgi:hypothetical protein